MNIRIRGRKAWAVVGRFGDIHLDKIMASKAEAWGLLTDESSKDEADLKANGYRCVRVLVRPLASDKHDAN